MITRYLDLTDTLYVEFRKEVSYGVPTEIAAGTAVFWDRDGEPLGLRFNTPSSPWPWPELDRWLDTDQYEAVLRLKENGWS